MKTAISFCDLAHEDHSCNGIPIGVSMVASYSLEKFKDGIEAEIFKYPLDYITYLEKGVPDIVCFSNYIWNLNLSYEIALSIKSRSPGAVVVFGGPNYPLEPQGQAAFLQAHPAIDFYVFRNGEVPFSMLFETLRQYDFDAEKMKADKVVIPGCHYLSDGDFIAGEEVSAMRDLDEIPSPYLTGLCDKFLANEKLVPLMLTARGCPFKCTFCQEGKDYFNVVRKFSFDRVRDELDYVASRTKNPDLIFADSNFGMYKHDADICREIVRVQESFGWPKYFVGIMGKNKKARVLEAAEIIRSGVFGGGSVWLSSAIQSTDDKVLEKVKRSNIDADTMIKVANESDAYASNQFSELILALPGDSLKAHFKSVCDLIETGVNVVRSHQYIMLNGSEAATVEGRTAYNPLTRFRVTPHTMNSYSLFGQDIFAPEVDEICVGNDTMTFADYEECRMFDLTVEVFYNNALLLEMFRLLKMNGIRISSLITRIHEKVTSGASPLAELYEGFRRETNELFDSPEQLYDFLHQDGVAEQYKTGKLGNNEQLMYSALMVFRHMEDVHGIAYGVAGELLRENGTYDDWIEGYIAELIQFSLLRKQDMLNTERVESRVFHYDFIALEKNGFNDDPRQYVRPDGMDIHFTHDGFQRELIAGYRNVYGTSNGGLGNIFGMGKNIRNFYRKIETGHHVEKPEEASSSLSEFA
ncbi:MAG: hypothetical protein ISR48_08785 [Alphaproteobacteria bacterium]|nr:hypothetical protein [Alphaproteobacteria bacterium]